MLGASRRSRRCGSGSTERARRIVFFAQVEAGRLGENYVSTEHLLLGLLWEADGLAGRALTGQGVDLARARDEVRKLGSDG